MTGEFRWNANLPVGPAYALSIKDARDYTGGVRSLIATNYHRCPSFCRDVSDSTNETQIFMPLFKTTAGNCSVSTPVKPSSLDVTVSGK